MDARKEAKVMPDRITSVAELLDEDRHQLDDIRDDLLDILDITDVREIWHRLEILIDHLDQMFLDGWITVRER